MTQQQGVRLYTQVVASSHVGSQHPRTDLRELEWEPPLTDAGEALVAAGAPEDWVRQMPEYVEDGFIVLPRSSGKSLASYGSVPVTIRPAWPSRDARRNGGVDPRPRRAHESPYGPARRRR